MKPQSFLLTFAMVPMVSSIAASDDNCAPEPGVCYSTDDCGCYYCLGPTNYGVNAPVRPKTCNGDFVITVAGFWWVAHQDGMEYAVENQIRIPPNFIPNPSPPPDFFPPDAAEINRQNNLIEAIYRSPDFKWDFGFKAGLGYNTTCDGWDIGATWTWYRGKALEHREAEPDDNRTLLPLWSAFAPTVGYNLFSTDIQTRWILKLNLVDLELGREFWTSKYLTFRPHIGLRYGSIKQNYEIQHRGGSWGAFPEDNPTIAAQPNFNNLVDINNDFHGIGIRSGIDTTWHLGCGWGFFGNLAASIVYGRFNVNHDETNRLAEDTHDKIKILDTVDNFRASRLMMDIALGGQWNTMFCDCQYGLTLSLAWEHHMFFDQNQMWRVERIGDIASPVSVGLPNNTGENVYHQRRGDLSTQGWTITIRFEF